jgi:hypothetical protein
MIGILGTCHWFLVMVTWFEWLNRVRVGDVSSNPSAVTPESCVSLFMNPIADLGPSLRPGE